MAITVKTWQRTAWVNKAGKSIAHGELLGDAPRTLAAAGDETVDQWTLVADNYTRVVLWASGDHGIDTFTAMRLWADQDVLVELKSTTNYSVLAVAQYQTLFLSSDDILFAVLTNGSASTPAAIDAIACKRNVADAVADANVHLVLIQ